MKQITIMLFAVCLIAGCAAFPTPEPNNCGDPLDGADGIFRAENSIKGRYYVAYKEVPHTPLYLGGTSISETFAIEDEVILDYGFAATMTAETARAMLRRSHAMGNGSEIASIEELQHYTYQACPYGVSQLNQRNPESPDDDCNFGPTADGTNVHACILDTGMDPTHPEFAGRIGEGFVAQGIVSNGWHDDHDHGTHVAGIFGGATHGVARNVIFHPIKVLDKYGTGTTSQVVEGIDWARRLKEAHPDWPVILNASLGGGPSPGIDQAMCRAWDAGVMCVVAAGNNNADACSGSPSRIADIIVVGAIDSKCRRASFSNSGQCLDGFAGGVKILSARRGGGFVEMSGTSMACPHFAGLIALYLQQGLGIEDVIEDATLGKITGISADSPNLIPFFEQEP